MFALTASELDFRCKLDDLLYFGCLPLVRTERSHAGRIDLLEAYVETYLTQEIQHGFGIYAGEHALRDGPLMVLPVADFLRALAAGRILRARRSRRM